MFYLIYNEKSNHEKIKELKENFNIQYSYCLASPINVNMFNYIIEEIEKLPITEIIFDLTKERNAKNIITEFLKALENSFVLKINDPKIFIISNKDESNLQTFYPNYYIFKNYNSLLGHLECYFDSYDKIEKWLFNRLPELNEDEAFYYMIIFRRKWLIKQNPDKEKEIRKYFNSDEMKIDSGLLKGNPHNFLAQLRKSINILFNDRKFKFYKGKCFNINKLYLEYVKAFSLLITFEPRSIIDGLRNFCFDMLEILTQSDKSNKLHELIHCDKTLISYIHKERRRKGNKFVLIDIDFDSNCINNLKIKSNSDLYEILDERRNNYLNSIRKYFENIKIISNVRYVCSTPSYGLHIILEIDENVGEKVFRNREIFRKDLIAIGFEWNYLIDNVEIKTGQCLTHIPYVNSLVKDYTNIFIE